MFVTQPKLTVATALAISLLTSGTGARAQRSIAPGDRKPVRALVISVTQERTKPQLEGIILQVDESGTVAEFSIGPEESAVPGRAVMVYRLTPTPRYVGKIVIVATEPGRGLGIVVDQR